MTNPEQPTHRSHGDNASHGDDAQILNINSPEVVRPVQMRADGKNGKNINTTKYEENKYKPKPLIPLPKSTNGLYFVMLVAFALAVGFIAVFAEKSDALTASLLKAKDATAAQIAAQAMDWLAFAGLFLIPGVIFLLFALRVAYLFVQKSFKKMIKDLPAVIEGYKTKPWARKRAALFIVCCIGGWYVGGYLPKAMVWATMPDLPISFIWVPCYHPDILVLLQSSALCGLLGFLFSFRIFKAPKDGENKGPHVSEFQAKSAAIQPAIENEAA